jgi:alpha-galactosidase/6-phospho-beta-glucosidase family protein
MELFDMAGRKMKTLLNENLGSDNHQLQLNRDGLNAGIYFLQFKTQTENITKKLVVE